MKQSDTPVRLPIKKYLTVRRYPIKQFLPGVGSDVLRLALGLLIEGCPVILVTLLVVVLKILYYQPVLQLLNNTILFCVSQVV